MTRAEYDKAMALLEQMEVCYQNIKALNDNFGTQKDQKAA